MASLAKTAAADNWIEHLPAGLRARWQRSIIHRAAEHMHRERSMPVGMAIAASLRWARHIVTTGDIRNWPGPQRVNPRSVAECAAALALWDMMRAAARARRAN